MVLRQLTEGTAESIPLACQDWANAKAAYRFFANEWVTKPTFCQGTFVRPASGLPPWAAQSWCSMTQPSFPTPKKISGFFIARSTVRQIVGGGGIHCVAYPCIPASPLRLECHAPVRIVINSVVVVKPPVIERILAVRIVVVIIAGRWLRFLSRKLPQLLPHVFCVAFSEELYLLLTQVIKAWIS